MSDKKTEPEPQNPRRNFIQNSILGASTFAGLSVASTAHASVEKSEENFKPEVVNEVDILVVGGAGLRASPQRCKLVEQELKLYWSKEAFNWVVPPPLGASPILDCLMPGANK